MPKYFHVQRAFTLIELLVVISVIALLVSLLLPALQKARDQAVITICQARQRMLGVATNAYATDSRQFYPNSYYSNVAGPDYGASVGSPSALNSTSANNLLLSYFEGVEGLYCPTFYHYYWPVPNNGAYNNFKAWQPGQDIFYGYTKYAGSVGYACVKPMGLYTTIGGAWADVGNLGRYINYAYGTTILSDESSALSPYYRPYASTTELDSAGICQWNGAGFTVSQTLGPSGAILWGDTNGVSDGAANAYGRATAHNPLSAAPGNGVAAPLNYTTGLNSVFGDGHVEWAVNDNRNTSTTKVISVDDSQAYTLARSARY